MVLGKALGTRFWGTLSKNYTRSAQEPNTLTRLYGF